MGSGWELWQWLHGNKNKISKRNTVCLAVGPRKVISASPWWGGGGSTQGLRIPEKRELEKMISEFCISTHTRPGLTPELWMAGKDPNQHSKDFEN